MLSHPWGQLYQIVSTYSKSRQEPPSSIREVGKGRWVFCHDITPVVPDEPAVILALQIAQGLTEEEIAVLDEVVNATRVGEVGEWNQTWGEEFSCRVWVKEILENLRMATKTGQAGILQEDYDVAGVESEALSCAKGCMRSGERRLLTSRISNT